MRWMRGGSVEDVLVGGKPDPEHAARIVDQFAGALSSAHRQKGPRDVKPANVSSTTTGTRTSDFGIARTRDSRDNVSGQRASGTPRPSSSEANRSRRAPTSSRCGMLAQDLLNGRSRDPASAGVIDRATADRPRGSLPRTRSELSLALREALGSAQTQVAVEPAERNPYKGLRAFTEADADDFFGRDGLDRRGRSPPEPVDGARFLAVVGPSGSGKSSVVRAGLIPTLRAGALPGSERWFYAEMLPGAHPFEELESALQRVAVSPPADLLETLEGSEDGLGAGRRTDPPR